MLELYKYLPVGDVEIILINDASTDEEIDSGVAWWQKTVAKHKIRYHKNSENGGFGFSMNEGAKLAKGDILVFLSNDVIISGDIFSEIEEKIKQDDKVLIGNEVIWYPAGWNEFDVDGKKLVIPWANGWLLACTKEVWDAIGGFDLRYGYADFEDVDISLTAQFLGYNLIALNSKFAKHIGAASFGYTEERMEHTKHNREVFIQKWQAKLPEVHDRLAKKPEQS